MIRSLHVSTQKWATWKRFILSFNVLGIHEDMRVIIMVVAISSHEDITDEYKSMLYVWLIVLNGMPF